MLMLMQKPASLHSLTNDTLEQLYRDEGDVVVKIYGFPPLDEVKNMYKESAWDFIRTALERIQFARSQA